MRQSSVGVELVGHLIQSNFAWEIGNDREKTESRVGG